MERNARIILLIEDDEFDRMTLTRMLKEHGYGVISTNHGNSALDTFAINHSRVSLVLASTGLSDVDRIKLDEGLYRIDPFVPVVIAARRASHRPNSGEDSGRHGAFATLLGEVERLLDNVSAHAVAQAQSFARVQAPAPRPADDEMVEWEDGESREDREHREDRDDRNGVFFPDIAPLAWTGSTHLTPIANLDPRHYLTQLSKERRTKWRRVRRLGLMFAAAACAPVVVPPLLEVLPTWQTRIARAVALDEPITQGAAAARPLASASISARIGIVPLVSSEHVNGSNVADDLRSSRSRKR